MPGNSFYYTAGFVEQVTPELSAFLAKVQADAPDQPGIHAGGAVIVMPLNGPFNEVAPDATAISARCAKFWVVFMLRLEGDEAQMAEGIAWGRGLKKVRRNLGATCYTPPHTHARATACKLTLRTRICPPNLGTRGPTPTPTGTCGTVCGKVTRSTRATGVHVDGGRGHRHAAQLERLDCA